MTRVLVIGGFLGAGKTTLMLSAARRLAAQGKRVGLVTNDQAPDMVDTRLVRLAKFSVAEVAGGCICCRFNEFTDEIGRLLRDLEPDVLLVEPVGSCVDLAATVLRPLGYFLPGLALCPLTTVVEPAVWLRLQEGHALPAETAYIYRKQLAEADIVLLNKSDVTPLAALEIVRAGVDALVPRARILPISAQTGAGLAEWCNLALESRGAGRPIEVDYEAYARGEEQLGWLNAIVGLKAGQALDWERVLPQFMGGVCGALGKCGAAPAHLKCLLTSGGFIAAANATLASESPSMRILATGPATRQAELVVNLRIALPPRYLRPALTAALEDIEGLEGTILSEFSFAPSRPVPQHRMA